MDKFFKRRGRDLKRCDEIAEALEPVCWQLAMTLHGSGQPRLLQAGSQEPSKDSSSPKELGWACPHGPHGRLHHVALLGRNAHYRPKVNQICPVSSREQLDATLEGTAVY